MSVIVDLEATCADDDSIPRSQMEIIEIGAVAVGVDGAILEVFTEFIRPTLYPILTGFCTRLTTITQQDVDQADGFVPVVKRFAEFVDRHRGIPGSASDWWGSWGQYDANQFAHDVQMHKAIHPLPMRHRNLKVEFSQHLVLHKKFGLAQAVEYVGLTFLGTHHRGVDDARSIAQLLPWIDPG